LDLDLFDYDLPPEAIAQEPAERRDDSRLMLVDRTDFSIGHYYFSDLPGLLDSGDVLVFNDSRVIPARLIGTKRGSGASIEIMLTGPLDGYEVDTRDWLALARPARRLKAGDTVDFTDDLSAEVIMKNADGSVQVKLLSNQPVYEAIEKNGVLPLPPYIKRTAQDQDYQRYQTVYAKAPGSVAAPTAGLHFTSELIKDCQDRGVQITQITLHVGSGTFQTVQSQDIEAHHMHSEWYHIDAETASLISQAHQDKRRVICVGTTSVRTLESSIAPGATSVLPGWRSTDIFIYPGYQFQMTDALITNFHLPKSTLLMLVSAFYQREKVLDAYAQAIKAGYRFYSYGDAMLIV